MKIASGRDFYDDSYSDGEDEDKEGLANRIIFPENQLYGSGEDIHKLKSLYDDLNSARSTHLEPPLAVVSGFSGAGKSTLVHTFINRLEEQAKEKTATPFFFLSGKFDDHHSDQPFSAIIQAFDQFMFKLLHEGNQAQVARVRHFIKATIGDEIHSLTTVVPGLAKLLEEEETDRPKPQDYEAHAKKDFGSRQNAWNQIKYLLQSLLRAISSRERPVILFLDNLHFADKGSLDLLSGFARDRSLSHLMLICSVRSIHDSSGSPVRQCLDNLEEVRTFERIFVKNLDLPAINQFVADALKTESQQTLPLSKAIYGKTSGNIFFTKNILEELQRKHILFFSVISFGWEWNLEAASSLEAEISNDILKVIVRKIEEEPDVLQRILKVASYTRSGINMKTLQALIDCDGGPTIDSSEEFTKSVDQAVTEGLLSRIHNGKGGVKFAHDQIQHAAMSLVLAGPEREQLKHNLAMRLHDLASGEKGENWMKFLSADYLNSSALETIDPQFLATLNLTCGETAFAIGAYQAAGQYLKKGLKVIRQLDSPWEKNYKLSMQLFKANAEVQHCLGNFDRSGDLCFEILKNCLTVQEKLSIYLILAQSKGFQEKHEESYKICISALQLDNNFPKRFQLFHMVKATRKVKRYFETHTDSCFLEIPLLNDAKIAMTIELLTAASGRAYARGNVVAFIIGSVRIILLSIEHGLCGNTALSLTGYAIYLSATGDQNGAVRMARLVREVLALNVDKSSEGITLFLILSFIESWSVPPEEITQSFQRAYRISLEHGSLEDGFLNKLFVFRNAFESGYPLDVLMITGKETLDEIRLYNVDSVEGMMSNLMLPIKNLASWPQGLIWKDLNVDIESAESKDTGYRTFYYYLGRVVLGVFFGNLEFAKGFADLLVDASKHDTVYINMVQRLFYSGLVYSRLARKTGRRKQLERARQYGAKLRRLMHTKGTNPLYLLKLMDADLLACTSSKDNEIQAAYDDAIALSMERRYIHFAALGNEIAGEFLLKKNPEVAGEYLRKARVLYMGWHASAKVEHLVKKYPSVFTIDKLNCPSSRRVLERCPVRKSLTPDLLSTHVDQELCFMVSDETEAQNDPQ